MLIRTAVCAAMAMLPVSGLAQQPLATAYARFGMGISSCATWLSNSVLYQGGVSWIGGFMTGANYVAGPGSSVGAHTDMKGIVGEVELVCRQNPAYSLAEAASSVYAKLLIDGR